MPRSVTCTEKKYKMMSKKILKRNFLTFLKKTIRKIFYEIRFLIFDYEKFRLNYWELGTVEVRPKLQFSPVHLGGVFWSLDFGHCSSACLLEFVFFYFTTMYSPYGHFVTKRHFLRSLGGFIFGHFVTIFWFIIFRFFSQFSLFFTLFAHFFQVFVHFCPYWPLLSHYALVLGQKLFTVPTPHCYKSRQKKLQKWDNIIKN